MNKVSNLTKFKAAVVKRNGSVEQTGYVTVGDHKEAHIEVSGLSHNACHTIEQELHFVTYDGIRGRHMEFTVEYGVER